MTTIRKIDPAIEPEIVNAIAGVYQESFGGEPWNEGYKCPKCGKVFPLKHDENFCRPCYEASLPPCRFDGDGEKVPLVEYWPTEKVISDFRREMAKPEAICLVAENEEDVVGFTWGYRVYVNHRMDSYFEAPDLHKLIEGYFLYLDEVAVVPSHQGKGIGKELVKAIYQEQKQGRILLRTLNECPMFHIIKNMGGEIVQHISKGRVIMALYIK